MASFEARDAPSTTPTPSTDTVVGYFVHARKAIAGIANIERASEIVTESRELLHLITGLVSQLNVQHAELSRILFDSNAIKEAMQQVLDACDDDFKVSTRPAAFLLFLVGLPQICETITETLSRHGIDRSELAESEQDLLAQLDAMHDNVRAGLARLQSVPVVEDPGGPAPPKTLDDFVDTQDLEQLKRDFTEIIDHTNEAIDHMTQLIADFDDELNPLIDNITNANAMFHLLNLQETNELYTNVTKDAELISENVKGLVRHYDLCLTALKYLEGGNDAVAHSQEDDPGANVDIAALHTTQNIDPPSNVDELRDMIEAIAGDDQDLDDIVQEINVKTESMEKDLLTMRYAHDEMTRQERNQRQAARSLTSIKAHIEEHVKTAFECQERWSQLRERLEDKTSDLQNLQVFYHDFLGAYKELMVEMQRRAHARKTTEQLVLEARHELRRAYKGIFAKIQGPIAMLTTPSEQPR